MGVPSEIRGCGFRFGAFSRPVSGGELLPHEAGRGQPRRNGPPGDGENRFSPVDLGRSVALAVTLMETS